MGKVSTNGDGPSSLQTRCTNCRTVFEVSPELLSSSDTRVRCGECLSIFDALANLRHPDTDDVEDDPPQTDRTAGDARTSEDAGEATDTDGSTPQSGFRGSDDDETGSLDVTYSDFDLFSGDAQLPEVAYLDETSDTPDFDFDTVDVDGTVGDETFSDTLFGDDATMEPTSVVPEPGPAPSPMPEEEPEFLEDDGTVEPPVFRYRDADATDVDGTSFAAPSAPPAPSTIGLPEDIEPTLPSAPKRRTSVGVWAIRSVMALLFVALLASLHLFRERGAWHNDPLIRPALVLGCRFSGCTVPSRVDLQSLRLLDVGGLVGADDVEVRAGFGSGQLDRIVMEQRQASRILSHGLSPRRKLLLMGPPGTGKTMTASVLAGELGLPLLQVRLDGLITKYMGETATKLRQVFEATDRTRGVYFFDEFDAIGAQRGMANDVGETRRILNSFLQMIEQDASHSLIVAATNHPDILDHALFRRFDDVLHYELPDEGDIASVLRSRLRKVTTKGVSWKRLAGQGVGLSYAEVTRAADETLKEALIAGRQTIAEKDIRSALDERLRISRRLVREHL